MEPAAKFRRKEITVLAASERFKRFRPEIESETRKQEVKSSPILESMVQAWSRCRGGFFGDGSTFLQEGYDKFLGELKGLRCSAVDIGSFSMELVKYQGEDWFSEKAGIFLSALMNNSADNEFYIHTSNLTIPVEFLGFRNTKNFTVDGNIGINLGVQMEGGAITVKGECMASIGNMMQGGTITVEGSVGDLIGVRMKGGTITVYGNAGNEIGIEMEGGAILVKGRAGRDIGNSMNGGEIHLGGGFDRISENIKGGRIFWHNELIRGR